MAELEIETNDRELIMELLGTSDGLWYGSQIEIPGGVVFISTAL
jgi:hypothetical protein